MIVSPAVDLKGGAVVQLVGGRPEDERVRWHDPVGVAQHWVGLGFKTLHIVDLDAALGSRDAEDRPQTNLPLIREIIESVRVPVQVGGGVRDDDAAARLLEIGAERVIVGTRGVEDPEWLTRLAGRYPDRIVVAADLRAGEIVTRGWTEGTGIDPQRFLEGVRDLPLAGVLVTDVDREGRLEGANDGLFHDLVEVCRHPLYAAGGITDLEDLDRLDRAGIAGAVLGMSLYTGAIDPRTVAKEFS